jgi:inner membrane transporter RhtA
VTGSGPRTRPGKEDGHGAGRLVPAPALFAVSGLTQYVGAAIAVGLFSHLPAVVVAWLRVAVAAVVLVAWQRPWRRTWTVRHLGQAVLFGVILAAMNLTFYVAIDHLPLGTVVAIEFIGPVAVGASTGRTARDRWAVGLAGIGVVLLAGVSLQLGPEGRIGLLAAAGAAVLWAGYVLAGRAVSHASAADPAATSTGLSGLAAAMAAGAVAFSWLAPSAAPVLRDPVLAAEVVAVAVASSVVPYGVEQVVMRRVGASTFAVLLAVLPATAAVVGAVMLRQWPTWPEVAGLGLVSGAILLAAPRGPRTGPGG